MNFMEALQAMKDGNYVRREFWKKVDKDGAPVLDVDGNHVPAEDYLMIIPKSASVLHVVTQPNLNIGNKLFVLEDYHATDWVVL